MASEEKSFEELVKKAPAAPAAETLSLVGTLAQSSEAGKFVLALQDGNAVTLETAAVKGHTVLGTSVGQTIVRVDVDAAKVPATASGAAGTAFGTGFRDPPKHIWTDPQTWAETIIEGNKVLHDVPKFLSDVPIHTGQWEDVGVQTPFGGIPGPDPRLAGGFAPFALATLHQAPASALAAMQGLGSAFIIPTGWWEQ